MKTEKQNEIRSLKGLNEQEVEKSKELYGTNELAQKPKASILSMFIDACNDIWIQSVVCSFDYESHHDPYWLVHGE